MKIDPLGGRLDDLLIEVTKTQSLGNISGDGLTFSAAEMRDADDWLWSRHNSQRVYA